MASSTEFPTRTRPCTHASLLESMSIAMYLHNEEIDSLISYLRQCKNDLTRDQYILRCQQYYSSLISSNTSPSNAEDDEPSVKRALHEKNHDRQQWIQAIDTEREAWKKIGVYEECYSLPEGRKALGCRLLLKRKRGPLGEILKYKARAIIQDFGVVQGIDYLDSFSAMANPVSIRTLMALGRNRNWTTRCQDIGTAYLTAELPIPVYSKTPLLI
eukprot:CAMPEP_0184325812 /NCGR_PEP_ID=MMETSP1049-20130417/142233_1 /TAXON_ID=77928 /ORGANISM="Proteomonas sulcata, Strain CCMP704" /LENGTH=214 /DNA_ID=CAMNT_0026647971 /DNA_START=698 /DNA_END=1342 /DNA_ORIENTATION=+